MNQPDAFIDPKAELHRLIKDHTCEWCGYTMLPMRAADDTQILFVYKVWRCRTETKLGYRSKHYRYWRLCSGCQSGVWPSRIISSIIRTFPYNGLLSELVAVQPMQEPVEGFWTDQRIEATADALQAHARLRGHRGRTF